MKRLLLVCAVVVGSLATAAPAAHACELQYCWWAKPVCDRVDCTRPPICWYTGDGETCLP